MKCRYCSQGAINPVTIHSYWSAVPAIACSGCAEEGKKQEAYECQMIDADCNDCKHFIRGKPIGAPKPGGDPNKKSADVWSGHCAKFNRPTKAYPNFASGHPCFEHRRA